MKYIFLFGLSVGKNFFWKIPKFDRPKFGFDVAVAETQLAPHFANAMNYYDSSSMSVEVLKDNFLQKITFRVKNMVPNFDQSQ